MKVKMIIILMILWLNGLISYFRCCSCAKFLPPNIIEDNCCMCNTAAIKTTTSIHDEDIVYASFYNRVGDSSSLNIQVQ